MSYCYRALNGTMVQAAGITRLSPRDAYPGAIFFTSDDYPYMLLNASGVKNCLGLSGEAHTILGRRNYGPFDVNPDGRYSFGHIPLP